MELLPEITSLFEESHLHNNINRIADAVFGRKSTAYIAANGNISSHLLHIFNRKISYQSTIHQPFLSPMVTGENRGNGHTGFNCIYNIAAVKHYKIAGFKDW